MPPAAGHPFQILNPEGDPAILLVCDHASNRVPPEYDGLGLPACEFERHIAWDIGAASITAALAKRLNAPAILANFSRLLIDPNRGADDPTLVMKLSDGAIIPDNRYVDQAERDARMEKYYQPYHNAIAARIAAASTLGTAPVLLSMHSFTPVFHGRQRPWHTGVLWDKDGRIALPLLDALRADTDLCVGDNLPYSGELVGDTMYRHGTSNGLPHALIELRQDLIATPPAAQAWAERLEAVLRPIIAACHKPETRQNDG